MGAFTPPIRRRDTAKGHSYRDATGQRVPGVTTILDGSLPKDALISWAANTTADAAVNRWEELAALPPAARLKALQGARYEDKDRAAKRGTEVHRYAELLAKGEAVQVPDELAGHVEAYARFLDEFRIEPVHIEFGIASYTHGYAGTGDLIAKLVHPDRGPHVAMLDTKTSRSGIFGSTALQLAGYSYADVLLQPDGSEIPMPKVDACYGVHVRADGYSLVPLQVDEWQHRVFLYCKQIWEWAQSDRELVGSPVRPPTTSTYRLTREQRP